MSEEHLATLAQNLKDAVLFDSQVETEKEYRYCIFNLCSLLRFYS